jgi:hypothetical protein
MFTPVIKHAYDHEIIRLIGQVGQLLECLAQLCLHFL